MDCHGLLSPFFNFVSPLIFGRQYGPQIQQVNLLFKASRIDSFLATSPESGLGVAGGLLPLVGTLDVLLSGEHPENGLALTSPGSLLSVLLGLESKPCFLQDPVDEPSLCSPARHPNALTRTRLVFRAQKDAEFFFLPVLSKGILPSSPFPTLFLISYLTVALSRELVMVNSQYLVLKYPCGN